MNEKISQLVDHELNPHQLETLLAQISNDEVAKKSWKCYHLIGSVIRGEVSSTGENLAVLIENNLQQEPTVLAPLSVKSCTSATKTDLWKRISIFAIAASLVSVAVLTLNPPDTLNKESVDSGNNRIANIQNTHQGSPESVARYADERFVYEFDEMLVNHAEFAISLGMSSLIVYAKLVSDAHLEQ